MEGPPDWLRQPGGGETRSLSSSSIFSSPQIFARDTAPIGTNGHSSRAFGFHTGNCSRRRTRRRGLDSALLAPCRLSSRNFTGSATPFVVFSETFGRAGSAFAEIVGLGQRGRREHEAPRPNPSQARGLRDYGRAGEPARPRDRRPLEVRVPFVSEISRHGHPWLRFQATTRPRRAPFGEFCARRTERSSSQPSSRPPRAPCGNSEICRAAKFSFNATDNSARPETLSGN